MEHGDSVYVWIRVVGSRERLRKIRSELSWNCNDSISGYRKRQVSHCSNWSFKERMATRLTYEERVSATSRLFHSKAVHRRNDGAGMLLDSKTALLKSISFRSKHTVMVIKPDTYSQARICLTRAECRSGNSATEELRGPRPRGRQWGALCWERPTCSANWRTAALTNDE